MLNLIMSNRLEVLAEALADHLHAQPLSDPLAPEYIVVAQSGVGRWLQLTLAERWGIAAQLRFELPAQRIGRLMQALLPASAPTLGNLWERDSLRWRVLALLATLPRRREFDRLRAYLESPADEDPLKRWQLASRLADLFDAYQVYRGDWLAAWDAHRRVLPASDDQLDDDEVWQAAMYRQLRASLPVVDRGQRMRELLARLQEAALPATLLPQRLSLFGSLPLGPVQMQVMAALARHCELRVYHGAPSMAYWADLRSPREVARGRARLGESMEASGPVANVLASLGRRAREQQQLQIDHWLDHSQETEVWQRPVRAHLLGWLQAAMLELDESEPPPSTEGAFTLQVHACAGPRREVEVALDAVLDCLARDPTLRPFEVAIMAPSLTTYAPLIEAVWAATPVERRLPLTIADGTQGHLHPLIQRYRWLLGLAEARCTRQEVLALFECAEIRARFELPDAAVAWLQRWVAELGVASGLNAMQREALGEGASSAHTWAAALDRLLMAYVSGDDGDVLDGVAPFAFGDGLEASAALGALCRLLRELERWRRRLQALTSGHGSALDVEAMTAALAELFDAFFLLDRAHDAAVGSDAGAFDAESAIRDALAAIAEQCAQADAGEGVSLAEVVAALDEELAQPARWQRFLGDGITVCAMVPLRSVPFRVIVVLGLDDGAFPRPLPPPLFDLMAKAPRLGDRQPREDDRQLLLDTLLAARSHLHLSYRDMDAADGSSRPPAPPLAELLAALRAAYGTRWVEVEDRIHQRHPLSPASSENFTRVGGSFAAQWLPAAHAAASAWMPPPPVLAQPLSAVETSTVLTAEQVPAFYHQPVRAFLREVLGLSRPRWIEDRAGHEPQSLDSRSARALLARLLRAQAQGQSIADACDRIRAEGSLPAGLATGLALAQLSTAFDGALNLLPDGVLRSETPLIEQRVGPIEIAGTLPTLLCADGPLAMGIDPPSGSSLLALGWARELLIAQGLLSADSHCVYLQAKFDGAAKCFQLAPLVAGESWLRDLVEGWIAGQRAPLLLPPRSAWAYANALAKGSDADAARVAARKTWHSDASRTEADDPDYALLLRGADPLMHADFDTWARRIYAPLVAALKGGGR